MFKEVGLGLNQRALWPQSVRLKLARLARFSGVFGSYAISSICLSRRCGAKFPRRVVRWGFQRIVNARWLHRGDEMWEQSCRGIIGAGDGFQSLSGWAGKEEVRRRL
jgi:hypothetical protein